MKKLIVTLMIVIIIFVNLPTFSYGSGNVFVNEYPNGDEIDHKTTADSAKQGLKEGSATVNEDTRYMTGSTTSGVAMASKITRALTIIPWAVSILMTNFSTMGNGSNGEYSTTPEGSFTIENVVFDRIEIMNANYFMDNSNSANTGLKRAIKNWYTGTQIIAIAASLVTLIYMGIRMGISTVASDKAKYKRMLGDWLFGFMLIFVLHFFIIFISNLSTSATYILSSIAEPATLESDIMEYNMVMVNTGKGWDVVAQAIIYWILVFYQLRFFLIYIKRFLMIGLLIVISPIMTITYAIDRAADKQSQIFSSWAKELSVNLFIQPLHALLYLVFMNTAGQIATVAPLLAVAFIMALSRGEKIVKGIFNLRGLQTIHSMGDTLKAKGG